MSDNRLRRYHIDGIIGQMLAARFDKEKGALKAAEAAIGQRMYETAYSKKHRELMASLPQGWLPEVSSIRITCGSGSSSCHSVDLPGPTRVPCNREHRIVLALEHDNPLWRAYSDNSTEQKNLQARRDEVRGKLRVLYNFQNAKKLLAAWPEAAPFIQRYLRTPQVPAVVDFTDLNKELKLAA